MCKPDSGKNIETVQLTDQNNKLCKPDSGKNIETKYSPMEVKNCWVAGSRPHNHHLVELAHRVMSSGRHNSDEDGLCVNINKTWNTQQFEKLLSDSHYHDIKVIDYLKYGCRSSSVVSGVKLKSCLNSGSTKKIFGSHPQRTNTF